MKNFTNPMISIIMPAYNGGEYITQAIQSVIDQTYKNWELIIIDDHSVDDSYSIAQHFTVNHPNIKLYQTEHKGSGAAVARNIGIAAATGRFIAFLDCDDFWLPKKLSKQINLLLSTDAHFCYSAYAIFNAKDNKKTGEFKPSAKISYDKLLRGCDIGCLTVIYDTEFLGKKFFPMVEKEDYALWLDIIKTEGVKFTVCNEITAYYRLSEQSISSNKWKELSRQLRIYRNVEQMSIFKSFFYLIRYALYGIQKHYFSYRRG
ncbi:glycosyltransferase family 2 protein [Citrobacter sp. wls830]|uniref:Glycosyl transferase n=1 Tax=Citrobacter werkmanii TaxID=67827 RepID=A0A2Z4BX67_9ENTR|nr:glycosyl transferase [Citrobacter werkmanii]TKU01411.1 glycosyltransferase family 2 protein [Citrobacter sp. wls830]